MAAGMVAESGRARLRARLAVAAVASVAVVLGVSGVVSLRLLRGRLVAAQFRETEVQSDTLRAVVEHEMLQGDHAFTESLAVQLGREPGVVGVMLLDHEGRVRVASDPAQRDRRFDRRSRECLVCHARLIPDRERSVTLDELVAGGLARTVTPLPNRAPCHRCHGASRAINGLLIIDRSMAGLNEVVAKSARDVVLTAALGMMALLLTLGFALERLLMRRLERLRQFTRRLGEGDLQARAGDLGADEIGGLAREFDAMASHLERAVEDTARERRQLDELVNGIDDGVLLLDPQLRVTTINRSLARRLDATRASANSAPCFRAALERRVCGGDASVCPAERALITGRLEKRILRMGGADGLCYEEIYATPLRDGAGAIVAVVEVWRDITHRKVLEAELVHREQLASLGMLASGVAHEVGNPLAAIATAVEGLLRRIDGPAGEPPEELREYLEIVQRQVFRCRDVTQRLLGFARRSSSEVRQVDAARALNEVLALCAPQARAQGVRVEATVDEGLETMAEEQVLNQVFLNLALNALKVMPEGGALRVTARRDGALLVVTFADTGPGIAPEMREHLFQPFQTSRPGGRGTGLGLFLSNMLVESCGGTLGASAGQGGGATFTVRLPIAGAAAKLPVARAS